jgi:glycosyltransferase involved in cell wall biosynthesis
MTFWQSQYWLTHTDSIYPVADLRDDPVHFSALREALLLLSHRHAYDLVVTMGSRTSLLYGLLCLILRRSSRQVICEYFLDAPARFNPCWQIKHHLLQLVARHAIGILTNSSREVKSTARRFGLPLSKVRYVHMHTNILDPAYTSVRNSYALAAGRTLRDWKTLFRALPKIQPPVSIITDDHLLPTHTASENIEIFRSIPYSMYLQKLAKCAIVIIPLLDTQRSTGQVVLFEAMALGKPIVVSDVAGVTDYVVDGWNALLVPCNDDAALAAAVNRLYHDSVLAEKLGRAAFSYARDYLQPDRHAKRKLEAIYDLFNSISKREILMPDIAAEDGYSGNNALG